MLITNTNLKWYQYQDDNGFVYRVLTREEHQLALAAVDPAYALLPASGLESELPRRWVPRRATFAAVRFEFGRNVLKVRKVIVNPEPFNPLLEQLITIDAMELKCVELSTEKKPL